MKEIVVIQERWVLIGEVTTDNGELLLSNAHCIRQWGTTHGLGEIAMTGPTKNTVLDVLGIVRVPLSQVLFRIECQV